MLEFSASDDKLTGIYREKMKLDLCINKILKLRQIIFLNVNVKTTDLIEEKKLIQLNFHSYKCSLTWYWLIPRWVFFRWDSEYSNHKRKIDKSEFINIKHFGLSKGNIVK